MTLTGRIGNCTWEVFPNTDGDVGGFFSYVENQTHYLGGDLHKTRAEAVAHAKKLAKERGDG